jgi:hypothetical protein
MTLGFGRHRASIGILVLAAAVLGGASSFLLGVCGPFTDVAADAFCPFVLEVFTLGITTGTTPTTYDPSANVSRLQMAAFLSRGVDGVLKRGSRRAALRQFSTPTVGDFLAMTTVGSGPFNVECDGADVWVRNGGNGGTVSRVRASDGKLLETWTGTTEGIGMVVALGRVFVVRGITPGQLYMIDPSQPAGAVTVVANNLGGVPQQPTFDGSHIWTANASGSVSKVAPGAAIPWSTTTVAVGTAPAGILYDGSNVWISDFSAGNLLKLDSAGAVLQTVTVGTNPALPLFDGANIWVPNVGSNSVSVVRASNGAVLATLTGNGLSSPTGSAFDGQRVLVTNQGGSNNVSLWKAADLTTLGSFSTGSGSSPTGAASDGVNFWVALGGLGKLARF